MMPPSATAATTRKVKAEPKKVKSAGAPTTKSSGSATKVKSTKQAAPKELIADKVDAAQALKAFKALAAYVNKQQENSSKNELPLDGPGSSSDPTNTVWVQITVKELNPERKTKPVQIPLTHSLLDENASVCLLTKDPQREYKDLLQEKNIRLISRVVGVSKLKGKFKPFDARRELVRDHELFLADKRIVPLLPKLCGTVFYNARKFPVPVDLEHRKRLEPTLRSAITSTYYIQNKGSCSTVKIGFLNRHSPQELLENLGAALPAIVDKIPGKWQNVQNIEVKTGQSAALPIWNCRLSSEGEDPRWAPKEEEPVATEPATKKRKAASVESTERVTAAKPTRAKTAKAKAL